MPWELVVDSNGDLRETSILVVHAAMLPTGAAFWRQRAQLRSVSRLQGRDSLPQGAVV